MQKILLSFVLTVISLCGFSQVLMNLDSLLKQQTYAKEDSNAVLLYINIGQQYESNEPELAKQYYRKAGDLSRKINYPVGVIKYISNYTYIMNMQGYYDSSLLLNLQSVEIARKIKDSVYIAKTLFNTGTSYRSIGDYENATRFYEEGKIIFAHVGNEALEAQGNDILQLLYFDLGQYDKAISHGEAALPYLRRSENWSSLGIALSNLGLSYAQKRDFKKAFELYSEALKIGTEINDINMQATQLLNIADIQLQTSNYSKMEPYFRRANELFMKLGAQESQSVALRGLALSFFFRKDFSQAAKYGEQALDITTRLNLRTQRRKNLETLSSIYFALHELDKGEKALRLSTAIGDTLLNETVQKTTLDLEKKYESEKKESRIKELTAEKKVQELSIQKKNFLNRILIAGAAVVVIISLLAYRNYHQKQKLHKQRISELETEKQLAATEAVLKGEEQERTRLAKDLHDGLGGMLSGIKYSFTTMKGNLIMTPENVQAFERSMDMLDSSIKEMRRVAHNMMPEALVKFGLDTALKDFCNDINQSGALRVNYQSIGMEHVSIDQTAAITIYRIAQELLNNIMKHAAAKNAIVQLSKADQTLSLTVEDDGKGFDPAILRGTRGIGWSNIQTRVEYLKGRTDVRSEPDGGTSVHIEMAV